MTAEESATLYKHLARIPGVDGETGLALKQSQKALGADIKASGNANLTDALENAGRTYAKDKSIGSLNKLIERHTVQTDNGAAINFGALSTGLKNWALSNEGAKAIKFTPGLKDDIVNLQALINTHPELKTLMANHQAHSILSAIFGNSLPSILQKNIGGVMGFAVDGPGGALAGEGAQLAARGIGKGAADLAGYALKSPLYEPRFRAALEAKVAPRVQSSASDGSSMLFNGPEGSLSEEIPPGILNHLRANNRNRELYDLGRSFTTQEPGPVESDFDLSQIARVLRGERPPERLSGSPPVSAPNWIFGQIPNNKALVRVPEVAWEEPKYLAHALRKMIDYENQQKLLPRPNPVRTVGRQ